MLYSIELRGHVFREWAAKIDLFTIPPKYFQLNLVTKFSFPAELQAVGFHYVTCPHLLLIQKPTVMKIQCWSIGKNHESYVKEGIEDFTRRLSKYFPAEWNLIPTPKNAGMLSEMDLRKKEGETILEWLKKDDYLILLDERGQSFTSPQLAGFLQARANDSVKTLVFLIGGAYGVDDAVFKRANLTWSLSKLVFPHQLVRLILAEQLYRACTILRNEKYHHV